MSVSSKIMDRVGTIYALGNDLIKIGLLYCEFCKVKNKSSQYILCTYFALEITRFQIFGFTLQFTNNSNYGTRCCKRIIETTQLYQKYTKSSSKGSRYFPINLQAVSCIKGQSDVEKKLEDAMPSYNISKLCSFTN